MKRLNPNTGLPFKRGDVREDGFIFFRYENYIPASKTRQERWFSPEKYVIEIQKTKMYGIRDHKTRRMTPSSRASILLRDAKKRAKINKAICTIDLNWIKTKIEKGLCELTGLPFQLDVHASLTMNPYAPSIDRIDPKNRNYTKDNCRLILAFSNRALNECNEEQALPILKAMIKGIENK